MMSALKESILTYGDAIPLTMIGGDHIREWFEYPKAIEARVVSKAIDKLVELAA